MVKMRDDELKSIIHNKITNSVNYLAGGAVNDRVKAFKYYMGEPLGNEVAGQSKVVSRDVAEAVDSVMPPLMRIFNSTEKAVWFEPTGPEDEEVAAQATDYVNHIWHKQNKGFQISYDWFKAALLYRIGIIKIWWEDSIDYNEESYMGLTQSEYDSLANDPDIEIKETESYPDETIMEKIELMESQNLDMDMPVPYLYDVIIDRSNQTGKIKIENVPTEEFLFDEYATDVDDGKFLAHRRMRTLSDLRDEGYSETLLKKVQFSDNEEELYYQEKTHRHQNEAIGPFDSENDTLSDEASRRTYVTEMFMHIDYDGDGIAEYRKITVAGESGSVILDNEPIDEHPFAVLTPIRIPFKMVGIGLYDQAADIQEIKSTLWRQALNNIYRSNNNRPVIGPQVNMDDVMNVRAAAPIRTKGNPQQDVYYPSIPNIAQEVLGLIQYADDVREQRTGITRYNQGLEADTLNKTATGIKMIKDAGAERVELIARTFGETGYTQAFKKILRLVAKYQQRPEIIKLRNKWVKMDPREWKDQYNVTVHVGIGTGSREKELNHLREYIGFVQKIVEMQGGLEGPFIKVDNVYNIAMKYQELLDVKGFDRFVSTPNLQEMQQRAQAEAEAAQNAPPTPEAAAYERAAEIKAKTDIESTRAKLAMDKEKFQMELQLDREKMEREFELKEKELQLKYAKTAFEVAKDDGGE